MSSPAPKLRKRKSHTNRPQQHRQPSIEDARRLSPTSSHLHDLSRSPDLSRDASLLEAESDANNDDLALVPVKSITKLARENLHKPKGVKRRFGFIFFLGGLFGLVMAGVFAQKNDLIDLGALAEMSGVGELSTMSGLGEIGGSLEGWLNVLPEGFLRDARELKVSLSLLSSMRPGGLEKGRQDRRAERG